MTTILGSLFAILLGRPSIASAGVNGAKAAKIKGWDVYGRVPHDDWLFSNWKLTNPNLLKMSLPEALAIEVPIAISNFRRRRRMVEFNRTFLTMSGLIIGLFAVINQQPNNLTTTTIYVPFCPLFSRLPVHSYALLSASSEPSVYSAGPHLLTCFHSCTLFLSPALFEKKNPNRWESVSKP
jgi:hypothetical protein